MPNSPFFRREPRSFEASPYSIDVNLWGRSCETGVLEDPWVTPPPDAYEFQCLHGMGEPLYEQIVLKACGLNLAGATVLRGIMGFGADSRIHTAKLLELSIDLPMVIEIVDTEENINKLLPFIDETVTEGLVTLEKMRVIKYRHSQE